MGSHSSFAVAFATASGCELVESRSRVRIGFQLPSQAVKVSKAKSLLRVQQKGWDHSRSPEGIPQEWSFRNYFSEKSVPQWPIDQVQSICCHWGLWWPSQTGSEVTSTIQGLPSWHMLPLPQRNSLEATGTTGWQSFPLWLSRMTGPSGPALMCSFLPLPSLASILFLSYPKRHWQWLASTTATPVRDCTATSGNFTKRNSLLLWSLTFS